MHPPPDEVVGEEFECYVHDDERNCVRGPVLITEIEAGASIDLYCDAPPWEDNAQPTRSLTNAQLDREFRVERLQIVCAKSRAWIRGRRPSTR